MSFASNRKAQDRTLKFDPCQILRRSLRARDMPIDDIFEAAKEADCQLVEDDQISNDTLKIGSWELMPLDTICKRTL